MLFPYIFKLEYMYIDKVTRLWLLIVKDDEAED